MRVKNQMKNLKVEITVTVVMKVLMKTGQLEEKNFLQVKNVPGSEGFISCYIH